MTGVTTTILAQLGLDPATNRLVEWQDLVAGDWTTDDDRSHALISFARSYGRTDAVSKVPPLQVTVKGAAALSPAPEIGDTFRLALCAPAVAALGLDDDEGALFTGETTDVDLDPAAGTWQIVAVHLEARQGRTTVAPALLPAATLHDRVAAVLAAVGATTGAIDPDVKVLAAPDAITPASALLDAACDAAPGQLVTQPDGVVDWHGRDHRRGATPVLDLSDGEIVNDLKWSKKVGALVNVATVNYAGGSIVVTDPASRDARGAYPLTVNTTLVDRDDAASLGVLIVGRRAAPAWALPVLNVELARTVQPEHLADVLRLRHGNRITITDIPATHPVTGAADFYVEGLNDTASRYSWRIGLAVSDPALSGISIRWVDIDSPTFPDVVLDGGAAGAAGPYGVEVDGGDAATAPDRPDLTWSGVDPEIRWLDVARIEDAADLGDYGQRSYDGGLAA